MEEQALERHTLVALVEDRPGVLHRITNMVRRRNFNIASLAVGHSEIPHLSRITFVVEGDEATVEQVAKQLRKIVNVVKVSNITRENIVVRELALIRVRASSYTRSEIMQLASIFRANIVDVAPESLILEVTGDEEKVDALVQLLKPFGILEMMRSGRLAMVRGMGEAPERGNGQGPRQLS